jgi:SWI/SNF-related matrix-associated actin-dependent regulator 1 of chromatin subfamily A
MDRHSHKTLKLLPYQVEGVAALERNGDATLLADEMGLGKTIQVLAWLHKHPEHHPCVVVCPASVKYNWQYEASRFGIYVDVLGGRKPPRHAAEWLVKHGVVVINYDVLTEWVPIFKQAQIKVIIFDEGHYLKSRSSRRFQAAREIARRARIRIVMTGTPLTNRPMDLWPLLHILWPDLYPGFYPFAHRYCRPQRKPWGWTFNGATRLPELHSRLVELGMVRRLKSDVLTQLPLKNRRVVPIPMRKREEYCFARDDFVSWLKTHSRSRASRAIRAQAVTRVGYLLRLCARLKRRAALEWVDDYLQANDGKIVVFAALRKTILRLKKRYGNECVVVDGSVTGRDRSNAIRAFQNNPRIRVFAGNIKAAGVGNTLTAADTCAFFEFPWTPGDLVQCEDRLHRIGQSKPVWINYLVARDTIEEHVCSMLQDKQRTFNAIVDGTRAKDDLSVFNQLLQLLEKQR